LLSWRQTTETETITALNRLSTVLSAIKDKDWTKENLENKLVPEAEKFGEEIGKGKDRGYLLWPLRVALTGKKASAGPFEVAEILGKEKTLKRLSEAQKKGRATII
jgi:glutamyl/glutaminyl-tRNA synthetase